ncbi:uncharacterized protein [Temnothorax longispinosus]|uniref:uncharacterized protein n=1 Tax=Temnothorax longispinosus TaxID=300112 RepID=UPI003A99204E
MFPCKLCGKIYARKSSMYTHLRLCGQEPKFSCVLCGRRFKYKHRLQSHLTSNKTRFIIDVITTVTHHGRANIVPIYFRKAWVCFQCGLAVSKVWSITSHEFRDTDDSLKARGFNDSVTFPTNADYSNERQILICNLCGNAYSWISSLRRHQLQCGNKEAKISCDFCAKKFYRRDRLKEHLFVYHSDVISECRTRPTQVTEYSTSSWKSNRKSWPCYRCGKRYMWRDSLKKHQRVECGKDPTFECPICGRKFKHKHRWQSHARLIHYINV